MTTIKTEVDETTSIYYFEGKDYKRDETDLQALNKLVEQTKIESTEPKTSRGKQTDFFQILVSFSCNVVLVLLL